VPTSHSQYNAIEATANYFASQNCAWGYPYKVYRVNTPQNQPYTNSLILNKTVFVPTMSSSYDAAALQAYREALPGYNVIGVAGASSTPWASTDALHCRTHEIPDKQMLYVNHQPYHGATMLQENYNFSAYIYPHSNMALYTDSLFVSYKANQGGWYVAPMMSIRENNFSTFVGNLAPGDTVRYYIHAADMSGRSINHPMTGQADPHLFWIVQDNTPPIITHSPIANVNQVPVTISAYVSDNFTVESVNLIYKVDSETEQVISMDAMGNNLWIVTFNPIITTQSQHLYYKIVAVDGSNPSNTGFAPMQGFYDVIILPTSNIDYVDVPASFKTIYPNPFLPKEGKAVTFSYQVSSNKQVTFKIYNIKGQEVKTLTSLPKSFGNQYINWDCKDNNERVVSAGIYLIKMETPADGIVIKKLMVMD
jgi:hypothetical protein